MGPPGAMSDRARWIPVTATDEGGVEFISQVSEKFSRTLTSDFGDASVHARSVRGLGSFPTNTVDVRNHAASSDGPMELPSDSPCARLGGTLGDISCPNGKCEWKWRKTAGKRVLSRCNACCVRFCRANKKALAEQQSREAELEQQVKKEKERKNTMAQDFRHERLQLQRENLEQREEAETKGADADTAERRVRIMENANQELQDENEQLRKELKEMKSQAVADARAVSNAERNTQVLEQEHKVALDNKETDRSLALQQNDRLLKQKIFLEEQIAKQEVLLYDVTTELGDRVTEVERVKKRLQREKEQNESHLRQLLGENAEIMKRPSRQDISEQRSQVFAEVLREKLAKTGREHADAWRQFGVGAALAGVVPTATAGIAQLIPDMLAVPVDDKNIPTGDFFRGIERRTATALRHEDTAGLEKHKARGRLFGIYSDASPLSRKQVNCGFVSPLFADSTGSNLQDAMVRLQLDELADGTAESGFVSLHRTTGALGIDLVRDLVASMNDACNAAKALIDMIDQKRAELGLDELVKLNCGVHLAGNLGSAAGAVADDLINEVHGLLPKEVQATVKPSALDKQESKQRGGIVLKDVAKFSALVFSQECMEYRGWLENQTGGPSLFLPSLHGDHYFLMHLLQLMAFYKNKAHYLAFLEHHMAEHVRHKATSNLTKPDCAIQSLWTIFNCEHMVVVFDLVFVLFYKIVWPLFIAAATSKNAETFGKDLAVLDRALDDYSRAPRQFLREGDEALPGAVERSAYQERNSDVHFQKIGKQAQQFLAAKEAFDTTVASLREKMTTSAWLLEWIKRGVKTLRTKMHDLNKEQLPGGKFANSPLLSYMMAHNIHVERVFGRVKSEKNRAHALKVGGLEDKVRGREALAARVRQREEQEGHVPWNVGRIEGIDPDSEMVSVEQDTGEAALNGAVGASRRFASELGSADGPESMASKRRKIAREASTEIRATIVPQLRSPEIRAREKREAAEREQAHTDNLARRQLRLNLQVKEAKDRAARKTNTKQELESVERELPQERAALLKATAGKLKKGIRLYREFYSLKAKKQKDMPETQDLVDELLRLRAEYQSASATTSRAAVRHSARQQGRSSRAASAQRSAKAKESSKRQENRNRTAAQHRGARQNKK